MGNSVSQGKISSDGSSKVIFSDGSVQRVDNPLTVAELMLDHPQQVVVEFKPIANGKKPSPLPADSKLEPNKVYMMLPMRRGGKPAGLSSEEARRLLMKINTVLKSKSILSAYTGFVPLFAKICPAAAAGHGGRDYVLNSDKNLNMVKRDEEESKSDYFGDIIEARPEFLSKQFSGKGWKPSLDTIKEKSFHAKIRHWLL